MNNNFIPSGNKQAPQQIRLWLAVSMSILGILLIVGGVVVGHQYYTHKKMKQEQQQLHAQLQEFETIMASKKKLTEEEATLKKQLTKIAHHKEESHDPTEILKIIKSYAKQGVTLEHIQYAAELAELKVSAHDIKTINTVAQQLPTHSWGKGLHMNSLEYKDSGVTAVLKNSPNVT